MFFVDVSGHWDADIEGTCSELRLEQWRQVPDEFNIAMENCHLKFKDYLPIKFGDLQ